MIEWWVDALVGLMMLWLAWQALTSPDLLRAVAMFVTFGLLVAIAWIRLGAPDVAIAEAAIGAGLTGALLLITIRRMEDQRNSGSLEKRRAKAD
ncbi:MAG: DUF4040 domain-containing protein [Gammaproteobacteria bacterium]|nr:DUF4040 domain-containing protein [Gammaproteobacteria bacterium]